MPLDNTSIGSAVNISDKVAVDDVRGTVTVFGKELTVGPQAATYLNGLIADVQRRITSWGAVYARQYGMKIAGVVVAKDKASKVGNAAELAWRYGLPVLDVAGGIKHAIGDGYAQMHELSNEASAVLAANNNMKVSVGGAMALPFSALAHERKLVFHEAKTTILASVTGVVKNLPNMLIQSWEYKKQRIENPEFVFQGLTPEASKKTAFRERTEAIAEERNNAAKQIKELRRLGRAGTDTQPKANGRNAKAVQSESLKESVTRIFKPQTLDDLDKNLAHKQWMPAVGGVLGEVINNNIKKNIGYQTSAWRNIKTLENVINEQEPKSAGDIESYVRDVFQQQVYDSGKKTQLAGAKYTHIIEQVSEALVHGGLHPQALVELLDDKKVIAFHGSQVTYGTPMAVKEELAKLTEKYTTKVSQKEFYKEAPFTPEQAVAVFKNLSEEERPLFTMLFPPGVLEGAGIKKEEVAKYRDLGKQSLVDDLTIAVSNLLQENQETLRKQGVKPEQLAELETIERDFKAAMQYGQSSEYVRDNLEDIKALVRNSDIVAKDPKKLWTEVIAPRETAEMSPQAMTPKGPMDHALRESSDAREIG